jgi:hypothetical protein
MRGSLIYLSLLCGVFIPHPSVKAQIVPQNKNVTINAFVMDPKYQTGPMCSTRPEILVTKGTQTIGGPPVPGPGIQGGRYVGIAGLGHNAAGALYVQIYKYPYGALYGWVPISMLNCKGNIAKQNLK